MNFTPFLPFTSTALPVNSAALPQLSTNAKFANTTTPQGGQVVAVLNSDESGVTYLRPIDTNGFALNLGGVLNNQQHNQIITLPITIPGTKPGEQPQQQTIQIQVVNPNNVANSEKMVPLSLQHFPVLQLAYNHQTQDGIQLQLQPTDVDQEITGDQTNNSDNDNSTQSLDGQAMSGDSPVLQDVKPTLAELAQHQDQHAAASGYPVTVVVPPEMILRTTLGDHILDPGEKSDDGNKEKDRSRDGGMNSWQATPVSSSVAEYLSHLPADSLPLSLHHFLKFSTDTIKRESAVESSPLSNVDDGAESHMIEINPDDPEQLKGKKKKKYKKKPPKPRRPRPGQVHIATALDGTLLFCCPECNMAYPDKEMLEQHLVAHKIDRRYICDICGAGLKRKEHLERHKLGHNPERPYVCEVCSKGFKRKEHLNLHAVIHSGEKTEICTECGKGFYRRDHLRKHTKSHIAKRMREELHQQQQQLHQMQEHQQHQQHQQQQHHTILITAPSQENGEHQNTLIIHTNPDHESQALGSTNSPDPLEGTVIIPAADENATAASLLIQQHQLQDHELQDHQQHLHDQQQQLHDQQQSQENEDDLESTDPTKEQTRNQCGLTQEP